MRLATVTTGDGRAIVAAALDAGGATWLADLEALRTGTAADGPPLTTMRRLLEGGDEAMQSARRLADEAAAALADPARLGDWRARGWIVDASQVGFLPPVPDTGKVIAVGANYSDHMAQAARQLGENSDLVKKITGLPEPVAFAKFSSTQTGHETTIPYPPNTAQFDFEAEMGIVVGRRCRNVSPDEALDCVAGYTVTNDVSLREVQMAEMARGVLLLGKNADRTLPAGPWLVTRDEVADPQALRISCRVNGELRQDGNTADMIHTVAAIVSFFSARITLEPGDLFCTGSPAFAEISPEDRYLKPGDVVEVEIESVGLLRNRIGQEG